MLQSMKMVAPPGPLVSILGRNQSFCLCSPDGLFNKSLRNTSHVPGHVTQNKQKPCLKGSYYKHIHTCARARVCVCASVHHKVVVGKEKSEQESKERLGLKSRGRREDALY